MSSAFIFYSRSSPNLCFDCRKWQQILLLKRSPSPFAFLSFLSPPLSVCHHSEEWLLLPSSGEDAKSCSDKQSVSQAGPPPTKPTAAPTTGIIAFQVLLRLQLKPLEEEHQRQQPAAVRLHERKARHKHSDGLALPLHDSSVRFGVGYWHGDHAEERQDKGVPCLQHDCRSKGVFRSFLC